MRLVLLSSIFSMILVLLGCSENNLHQVPPAPEEDGEPTGDGDGGTDDSADPATPPVDEEPAGPEDPVADAGPDRIWNTADLITLDGSASYDPNGEGLTSYLWSIVDGPVAVSLDAVEQPTFTTATPGTYTFELTVQNDAGLWDLTPATVALIVQEEPVTEPVANAGPDQTVDEGDVVDLNGSGSFDPNGLEPLTYSWQIVTRPAGSLATLVDEDTAFPTFEADVDGNYVIELNVVNSEGTADATPDTVVIVADNVILPPVADAGIDVNASTGSPVTLDGLDSSDPQGLTPLSYSWIFTERPTGSTATLASANGATPTFTPDLAGIYRAQLSVTNSAGVSDPTPDKVDIVVTQAVVLEPVAEAGADFGVLPLENVQLDGTGSYDPSGLDPLVYEWTMVSKPQGSTTSLSSTSVAEPTFFADLAGVYVFELTVMNTDGTWDTTPDVVQVEAIPLDGFYVELSWDNNNDLDLHILDGGAALWSDGDCNYCNLNPSWGPGGADDDPSLDADAIYGYGPETTTIDVPASGSYGINVHYYGLNGGSDCDGFTCPSTEATVKVYIGGILAHEFTRTMNDAGQVWDVASIDWPTGNVNVVDSMGTTSQTYCN